MTPVSVFSVTGAYDVTGARFMIFLQTRSVVCVITFAFNLSKYFHTVFDPLQGCLVARLISLYCGMQIETIASALLATDRKLKASKRHHRTFAREKNACP